MSGNPTRANPSTDAYERARKAVHGWLRSLHPSAGFSEDDGGQLMDSIAWEIDEALMQADNAITALGNLVCAQDHELRAARALLTARAQEIDRKDAELQTLTHSLFCLQGAVDRTMNDLEEIRAHLAKARRE